MHVTIKGEKEANRKHRNQLLEAEIALKDQIERVAALRRQLPKGPLIDTDYIFREGPTDLRDESPANFRDVRFSELFAPGKDRLIVDHLMWGPSDKLPCPMCNMLKGRSQGRFLVGRASPIERISLRARRILW